jgi:hypothetical protein
VLLAFFCADCLIFRTGWYDAYLEPDSSAGSLESQLHWLRYAAVPKGVPDVLVVGDSRIAEGFSPRIAASSVERRLHFWNFGIPGTTPRVWYYALRDADPDRRRFAAIVLAIDNYSDADWFDPPEDRMTDENFLAMRLGLGDCADFALSIHTKELRHSAFFGCLFRGVLLRQDVQAFLAHPKARVIHARDWLTNGLIYRSNYGGKAESLHGLTIDWQNRTILFPPGLSDGVKANVSGFVLPEPVPNTGELARYRQRWLGGILDFYKDSPTRMIFLQLPRGPLVKPGTERDPGFVDGAARISNVSVLPAETFTDLESPDMFADGLHLNRQGRPVFSQRLAGQVESLLAGGHR